MCRKGMFKKGCSAYSELNDKRWLEKKYSEEGLNTKEIAAIVGCSYPTVLRAIDCFGIPKRSRTEANIKFSELWDKEWLQNKYVHERFSADKIGNSLGCDNTAVLTALKRFGIRPRTAKESHPKRPELEDPVLLRSLYVDERKGLKAIGNILGCTATTVASAFKKHNIKTRPQSDVFKGGTIFPKLGDKKWLYQKYCVELLSGLEIGSLVGCSNCAVLRNLAKQGIPTRTISEAVALSQSRSPCPRSRTSIETILENIFKRYTDCIEYTGDGSFWITTPFTSLNPDFIIRDKKIAIEANGDYWHSPLLNRSIRKVSVATFREKYLKVVGWKLIVFWETDIKRKDAEAFVVSVLRKNGII